MNLILFSLLCFLLVIELSATEEKDITRVQ